MAKTEKVKLVPVKIGKDNVTINGKIHKKETQVEVPEDQAKILIDGEHATAIAPAPGAPPAGSPAEASAEGADGDQAAGKGEKKGKK